MPDLLDQFVHDENLRLFAQKIETERDPVRLAMLRTLLKEEQGRWTLGQQKA